MGARTALLSVVAVMIASAVPTALPLAAAADGPTTWAAATAIQVPAPGSPDQSGPASPYPSTITVSGMAGAVSAATVTLHGLTHSAVNDLDVLLVGPSGANLVVLADIGDPTTPTSATNATVTFSDDAAQGVPTGTIPSGTYRPTAGGAGDFPAPAPPPSTQTTLSGAFAGTPPNGTWSLFVVDDTAGDVGTIAGGWSLVLTTEAVAAATTTTLTSSGSPSRTGAPVTFTATVDAAGAPVSSGTVQFSVDGADLAAPVPVDTAGRASVTTSALPEGTRLVRAVYSGATGFLTSNDDLSHRVDNQTVVSGTTYCNPGPNQVPGIGPAAPYPSAVTVSGLVGIVSSVTVRLDGLTHSAPVDLDVLLAGPDTADNLFLLSDAGGTGPVSNLDLVLDDDADSAVPTPLASGTFRPTRSDDGSADSLPAPAPAPGDHTTLAAAFAGSDPNGTWTLWVADDSAGDAGSFDQWCVTVAVEPVIADAGGPYTVAEGGSLTLDGSGSTPGATLGWDLDGDGDFTDAVGTSPILTWAALESAGIDDGPAVEQVRVRATVGSVNQISAPTYLIVTNTAPTAVLTGARTATAGALFTIKVGADDPSAADLAALFTYTVDWGDGTAPQTVVGPADPPVTHVYASPGDFTASFTATDKDGGLSAPTTTVVVVAPATTSGTTTLSSGPSTTTTSVTGRPGSTSTGSQLLAATGSVAGPPAAWSGLLLAAGVVLLLLVRRRGQHH